MKANPRSILLAAFVLSGCAGQAFRSDARNPASLLPPGSHTSSTPAVDAFTVEPTGSFSGSDCSSQPKDGAMIPPPPTPGPVGSLQISMSGWAGGLLETQVGPFIKASPQAKAVKCGYETDFDLLNGVVSLREMDRCSGTPFPCHLLYLSLGPSELKWIGSNASGSSLTFTGPAAEAIYAGMQTTPGVERPPANCMNQLHSPNVACDQGESHPGETSCTLTFSSVPQSSPWMCTPSALPPTPNPNAATSHSP
jgi:hypothetical protein